MTDTTILTNNVKMLWDRLPQDVRDDYGTEFLDKCKFGSLLFLIFVFNSVYLSCSFFPLLALVIIKDKVSAMSDGDLMKVVNCMEHAVSAVRPRTRYSPGWDAKVFWLPLSYMPTFVFDYIMLKQSVPIAKQQE